MCMRKNNNITSLKFDFRNWIPSILLPSDLRTTELIQIVKFIGIS